MNWTRIAGLALAILAPVAFGVAGAPLPTSPDMPAPEETGARVLEVAEAAGLNIPEGIDATAIGQLVHDAMPAEPNIGTPTGLGESIAGLVSELGGSVPSSVPLDALGQAVIDVTPAVREALRDGEWGPLVYALIGLVAGLLLMWLGGRKRETSVVVTAVIFAALAGGCAHQSVQGAVVVDVKAGPGGGVFAKAEGDPDYRVSLTGDGVTQVGTICGIGEHPVGTDRTEVTVGGEAASRWVMQCVATESD